MGVGSVSRLFKYLAASPGHFLTNQSSKYNLLPACEGGPFWAERFFFFQQMLHWDTSTFDACEKVKLIHSWIFKVFLYDTYTGLNTLQQKNVKCTIEFEKCISILTYFVLMIFENVFA